MVSFVKWWNKKRILQEGFLCPQLRRSWRGILVSGCLCIRLSIHSSKTVHARVLKFHIWIPHGKIFDAHFFSCPNYLPFWSYVAFNKIRMKSDGVLTFHIWIPLGKIADLCFFSCPSYLPFWSYAPLKKSEWNLVSKISWKVFELGAWNLVSW